jgi:hypothetical protein
MRRRARLKTGPVFLGCYARLARGYEPQHRIRGETIIDSPSTRRLFCQRDLSWHSHEDLPPPTPRGVLLSNAKRQSHVEVELVKGVATPAYEVAGLPRLFLSFHGAASCNLESGPLFYIQDSDLYTN